MCGRAGGEANAVLWLWPRAGVLGKLTWWGWEAVLWRLDFFVTHNHTGNEGQMQIANS